MTVTHALVQDFEQDQQAYGTTVAIFNLLWRKAAEDLSAIGVSRISTRLTPRVVGKKATRPAA